MLTDSEKRWLQLRKLYAGVNYWSYYSCMHCSEYNIGRWRGYNYPCGSACLGNGCPYIDIRSSWAVLDYVEATKFEARVAAKLAERCVLLEKVVQKALGAAEYINLSAAAENALKAARLQVEEEMDAE